jgi:hypothetical protein
MVLSLLMSLLWLKQKPLAMNSLDTGVPQVLVYAEEGTRAQWYLIEEPTLSCFLAIPSQMEVALVEEPSLGADPVVRARWYVADTGLEPLTHLVWGHKSLLFCLSLLGNCVPVDISSLAGAGFVCQRLVVIEGTLEGNRESPRFGLLHEMIKQSLQRQSGGLMTAEFALRIAEFL